MNRREQRPRVDREPISSNQRGKADGSGKRWVGRWVNLGKGGQVAGTWTGFSRLFPLVSTQVVDFPHLSTVRLFWEAMNWAATDETRVEHGFETERNGSERSWQGKEAELREITRTDYGLLRQVSRKFAQIRPVNPRCYALLRVRLIFCKSRTHMETEKGGKMDNWHLPVDSPGQFGRF